MKKIYMEIDSEEAMQIMKELRHTQSPLTTLFLLMDYTSAELETSISKISTWSYPSALLSKWLVYG